MFPKKEIRLIILGDNLNLNEIRKSLYNLYPGNWSSRIADLGNLILGGSADETYGRVISLLTIIFKKNIIPVIIGGSQDLLYLSLIHI